MHGKIALERAQQARAVDALGSLKALGAPALPRLRKIMDDAEADPEDYLRAYSYKQEMPLHVRAYFAVAAIESALKDRKPAAAGDPSAPEGKARPDKAKPDAAPGFRIRL